MCYIACVFSYVTWGGSGRQEENYHNKKQNKIKVPVT